MSEQQMSEVIRFDSNDFLSLGINHNASSWNVAELLVSTYESQCAYDLVKFLERFNIEPTTKILTSYTNKKGLINFSLPRLQIDRDDQFSLIIGNDLCFPLIFKRDADTEWWETQTGVKFEILGGKKTGSQEISWVYAKNNLNIKVNGIKETLTYQIPVLCSSEANHTDILIGLQNGELREGILKAGTGNYNPELRIYMLPSGCYRITSSKINNQMVGDKLIINVPSTLENSEGVIFNVNLNTAPFMVRGDVKLVDIINKPNAPKLLLYVDGAYTLGDNKYAAVAFAGVNHQESDDSWIQWAKKYTDEQKQKYQSKLLTREQIDLLAQKHLEKHQERLDKKAEKPTTEVLKEPVTSTSNPFGEDTIF
jgi:hypothetical protein